MDMLRSTTSWALLLINLFPWYNFPSSEYLSTEQIKFQFVEAKNKNDQNGKVFRPKKHQLLPERCMESTPYFSDIDAYVDPDLVVTAAVPNCTSLIEFDETNISSQSFGNWCHFVVIDVCAVAGNQFEVEIWLNISHKERTVEWRLLLQFQFSFVRYVTRFEIWWELFFRENYGWWDVKFAVMVLLNRRTEGHQNTTLNSIPN